MEFFEMATLGTSSLGLVDALRQAGDAANANIVEILNRLSPVYRNGMYVECNNGTAHKHTIRTGLPSVPWGRLYQGIPASKSARVMVQDTTGFVEGLSSVDERLLEIAKNAAALRMSEAESFVEAMAQEIETGFFYHDVATTPEKFKGLAARYNKISGGGAIAKQIIDAGGTGTDNTSIWFVTHSEKATCLPASPRVCPPASSAGQGQPARHRRQQQRLLRQGRAVPPACRGRGSRLALQRPHLQRRCVRHDRRHRRSLQVDAQGAVPDAEHLRDGARQQGRLDQRQRLGRGPHGHLHEPHDPRSSGCDRHQQLPTALSCCKPMELEGRTVQSYRGIPIEISDALLSTEARVV
jgi:hypothetical protein